MKTFFTIIALCAGTVHAGMWLVVDTRTTNAIPNQRTARMVDVADQSAIWPEYRKAGGDMPNQIPAWFNDILGLYSYAPTYTGAVAEIRTMDNARRTAKAELEAALAGGTIKARRKPLRDAVNAATTVKALREAMRDLDAFNELIEAKRAEDQELGITKEEAP